MHAPPWVLTVETQVEGEVVAGAGGDADERQIVFDGDGRHEGLRAVASGHAQAVGAAGDRVAGELLEIEAVIEHHHLDAELLGQRHQIELLDLASAGPGVADQDGVARRRHPGRPLQVTVMELGDESGTGEPDGGAEEDDDE